VNPAVVDSMMSNWRDPSSIAERPPEAGWLRESLAFVRRKNSGDVEIADILLLGENNIGNAIEGFHFHVGEYSPTRGKAHLSNIEYENAVLPINSLLEFPVRGLE